MQFDPLDPIFGSSAICCSSHVATRRLIASLRVYSERGRIVLAENGQQLGTLTLLHLSRFDGWRFKKRKGRCLRVQF